MDEWIKVDVGGKIFETSKETLLLIPYFQSKNRFNPLSSSSEIKIDQDPDVFKQILRSMRNPAYIIPEKYNACLDFWGLPELKHTQLIPLVEKFDVNSKCLTTINIPKLIRKFDFWKNFEITLASGIKSTVELDHEVSMESLNLIIPSKMCKCLKIYLNNKFEATLFASRLSESIWISTVQSGSCRRFRLIGLLSEIFVVEKVHSISFKLVSDESKDILSTVLNGRISYVVNVENLKFMPHRLMVQPSYDKFKITEGRSDLFHNIKLISNPCYGIVKLELCFVSRKIIKTFSCFSQNDNLLFRFDYRHYKHFPPFHVSLSYVEEIENSYFIIEPKMDIHYYLIIYYNK